MLQILKEKLFKPLPSFNTIQGNVIKSTQGDKYIWGIVVVLSLVSILVVYSATGSLAYSKFNGNTNIFLFKQFTFSIFGLIIIYFLHKTNYMIFLKISKFLYIISIPLLLYTLIYGAKINEGSRWIKIPILHLTIQTSDFAKLSLYMYLSRLLSKNQEHIKEFKKGFLQLIIPIILTCVLIMPANLSNALLTGATSLMLLFIGRVNLKYIFFTILIASIPLIIIVSVAVSKHKNIQQINNTTQIDENSFKKIGRWNIWITRVQDFIYTKDNEPHYQVLQAKIAIANGGLLMGLGPGNSHQRNFLPQAYNDFIFAIIIEEYGLFGGAFIIFIYIIFLFRCLKIAKKCPYAFGTLLAVALSFTLTIQAMANMAVCVNLLPVTGITLPLISLGGSSFIFTSISIGIILSVSRNVESIEGNSPAVETSNNEIVTPLNQLSNE